MVRNLNQVVILINNRGIQVRNVKLIVSLVTSIVSLDIVHGGKKLEDYFPEELRGVEVRRKTLEPAKRKALEEQGAAQEAIDLYGDVYVKGYECDQLRWGDVQPDDRGPLKVTYNTEGMRKLPPLPKEGHPRMFFTDGERQMHRDRLEKTKAGKHAMKVLNACISLMKGTYDNKAEYAKPDIGKGRWGTRGFLPLFRYGNFGNERNKKIWAAYSSNRVRFMDRTERIKAGILVENKNSKTGKVKDRNFKVNMGLLALEAYRCWVWNDKEGAKLAANALESSMHEALKKADVKRGRVGNAGFNFATCYDMLYNYMSPEARSMAQSIMIVNNYDNNQYGCFQDAASSTSNWTTFSYRINSWLPLETHPAFNDLMYKSYVRGMHNFLTYGWFRRGPCYEGMGKNQLGGDIAYVLTRRGENVIGHPHLLANMRDYMPHAIVPWGGQFVAYDRLGGRRLLNATDILPIKYMYPDDKKIDWVYRNTVYEDYSFTYRNIHSEFHIDNIRVEGWVNNALLTVMFLSDYIQDNNDPGKLGIEESFFGPQRGLMITRSDWTKKAAYLHHHCRGASGGHVFADRNNIVFGGKGRMFIRNGSHSYKTHQNNVVTIDNWSNGAPVKMIDYKRTPFATFSCGDAKPSYDWKFGKVGSWGQYTPEEIEEARAKIPEGWEENTFTFNDFSYENEPVAHFNQSSFSRCDWLKPGKINAQIRQRRTNAVKKAFRSAGVVRGAHPYALIVDDIAASDDKEHEYTWHARLPEDLALTGSDTIQLNDNGKPVAKNKKGNHPVQVLTVMGAEALVKLDQYGRYVPPHGTPAMKVIILNQDGKVVNPRLEVDEGRMLRFGTVSKAPNYKVILYPYLHGKEGTPSISFTADGDYVIEVGKQKDIIIFKENNSGRTGFSIRRMVDDQVKEEFSFGL